jgi:hypothetical protein
MKQSTPTVHRAIAGVSAGSIATELEKNEKERFHVHVSMFRAMVVCCSSPAPGRLKRRSC